MADPPGSTPFVRFDTEPLITILRGADAAAGFVSPEADAPGSTPSVAFDTSPPLWFDFPAPGPVRVSTPPATTGTTTATPTRPTTTGATRRPAARRPHRGAARPVRAPSTGTLAATGAPEAPGVVGLAVLAVALLLRRRRTLAEEA